ncbi:bacterial Ig-like domain-containing protein, partial [Peptoniphilus hominis (ex Hitch et al. 2025)]
TEALTVNEKVFDPAHVEKMVVKTQPTKLIYTEGENLALAGLVVTLTDNQGVTKDVAFKDFAANGITAEPANDTALTLADNGKPVALTKGSLQDETANLTVNAKVTPQDPIVGPVDPSVTPNPDEAKNWTVTFAADQTKGTIDAKNTFYVPKTAGKTLADLANDAPEVIAKAGFMFTGWNPALDAKTSINGNLTVNATFETTTTPQDPIVGPVDPSVTPNPDEAKNWTVTFAADQTKGTIDAKNTFYVPKTAGKTLADLANDAPEVTAKAGFMFTGWNPALDANTAINGNMTINAEFETTTTIPKVVVPDPVNPGTVPTGRVRVTFDAGDGNTIDGRNRYKYLDVLENTAWTDREVTDEIPAKAKYKDATQEFDKWDKEVPTKGNVTEETFTAIYTGNSFDLFADTLSAGETGIIVRTSIPEVKITLIKGGKVIKEAYTNDLGVVTIILNDKVEKGDVYKIIGEMKGYKTQEIFATVVSK